MLLPGRRTTPLQAQLRGKDRQQNEAIQVILLPTFYCPQKSKEEGLKIQKPELKTPIFAPHFFVVPAPPLSRGQSPLLLGFLPIYEQRIENSEPRTENCEP